MELYPVTHLEFFGQSLSELLSQPDFKKLNDAWQPLETPDTPDVDYSVEVK
jgi:hypothetical protein